MGRDFNFEKNKDVYWHSTAHILAQAVKELFPEAKLGIGPAIEQGFYYDFDVPFSFTPEHLKKIEEKMKEIIKRDIPFVKEVVTKEQARKIFEKRGEIYKLELLNEIPEEKVSIYWQGDFVDLCKGPHVPSTGYIKAFKLLSVSGAYWRGDEKRPMMQRIYGISFPTKEQLEDFLKKYEEAKRRDHRKLGPQLEIFTIYEEVGPGLVIWYPKGYILRKIIEDFLYRIHLEEGYQFILTPHIARGKLWEISGHLDYYAENMYVFEKDNEKYAVKPMNCPFHILVYKSKKRSYKELPFKIAEFGTVYRYERSGTLHGLLRVRGFTQDDAHIFTTEKDFKNEIINVLKLAQKILNRFGFKDFDIELSVRDPSNKEKYMGDDKEWEHAEKSLAEALEELGFKYRRMEGEAVFYGPKIDLKFYDALGRKWQATTIQIDFNLPRRFDVTYIGRDNKEHRPYIIHRAILGSFERFIGILIENYAGNFPLWLAPVQVIILPVSEKQKNYALNLQSILKEKGFRVEVDLRNEKIGYKIREAEVKKINYMLIIGKREEENKNVSVRKHGKGDLGSMDIDDFIKMLEEDIKSNI